MSNDNTPTHAPGVICWIVNSEFAHNNKLIVEIVRQANNYEIVRTNQGEFEGYLKIGAINDDWVIRCKQEMIVGRFDSGKLLITAPGDDGYHYLTFKQAKLKPINNPGLPVDTEVFSTGPISAEERVRIREIKLDSMKKATT